MEEEGTAVVAAVIAWAVVVATVWGAVATVSVEVASVAATSAVDMQAASEALNTSVATCKVPLRCNITANLCTKAVSITVALTKGTSTKGTWGRFTIRHPLITCSKVGQPNITKEQFIRER